MPVLLWWAPDFSPCWPWSPLAPTCPSHIIVIKLFLTLQCSAPPLGESMSLQRSFWDPYPRLWAFQGDPYLPGLLKLQSKFSHSLSNPSRLSHLCTQAHVWLFNYVPDISGPGTFSSYLSQSSPPFELQFKSLKSIDCFLWIALRAFTTHDDFFFFLFCAFSLSCFLILCHAD